MSEPGRLAVRPLLAIFGGFAALFCWVYARPLLSGDYLSESDLYEYYLPIFLSPITTWSSFEFAGLPAFADPGDFVWYPPHFVFARLLGSWTGLAISAHVLAASFTAAYVRHVAGSWRAAVFAGAAYGLSEAMVERLPHMGTLHAFAWLPLIALAIDRLRGPAPRRWLAVGAVAVACCFLAGHPQLAIYTYYICGAYALAGGWAERAGLSYYARVAGLFALGGLLAAIKLLPLGEASLHMARQVVSFEQFVSRAVGSTDALATLFPSIQHDGREAPLYVGLATVALAVVGMRLVRRNWRAGFWLGAAALAVLVSLGNATPVARLAYAVPLLDNFRVAARLLFVAAFGAVVLAGFAVAAIERRDVRWSNPAAAAALLFVLLAAGATVILQNPARFSFEARPSVPSSMPLPDSGIWWQFGIAAAVAGTLVWLARARRPSTAFAVLLVLLAGDLLFSLPYAVSATGIRPITIPREHTEPSVHARELARLIAPGSQRLLAVGGTHRDAVVPAAFARLWRIPIAGGYGPMLLARHNALATMGTNGSVTPDVLAWEDAALDLLSVRYIVVREDDWPAGDTFERDGVRWDNQRLELSTGRPDCSQPYTRRLSIAPSPELSIASVTMVGYLRCSEHVPQGSEAARVVVTAGGAMVAERLLVAGVDIADREIEPGETDEETKHQAPRAFDDPDLPRAYVSRVDLPAPAAADRIEIRGAATGGWTTVERLTLVDAEGRSWPQRAPEMFLRDARRWREHGRFQTSRTTDRGRNDDVPGEEHYVVYENLRALPRAWVVSSLVAAAEADMAAIVHASQLPDGSRFDPQTTALVDPGTAPFARVPTGRASARVTSVEDGRIAVDVETESGGFLVLSEAYYPGWRARIGDRVIPVQRANVSLQGVPLPAGRHTVVFEFVSTALRAGAAISALGLMVVVVLVWKR
jgi:hypothetical protein